MDRRPLLEQEDYENDAEVVLEGSNRDNEEEDEKKFHRHCFRWVIMGMFIICGVSNTWVQLSFSPIIWQSQMYFGKAFDGEQGQWTLTGINALSALFPILYIPGSYKAAKVLKRNDIRAAITQGMVYTTLGSLLRFFSANAFSQRDPIDQAFENSTVNYVCIFVGTWMIALAQPIFLNTATMVALVWFSVAERELAMTAMTLTFALGSALGSTIPTMVVTWEPWNSHQTIRIQVQWLMLIQFVTAMFAMLMAYNLFANQPPTPPSRAAEILREEAEEEKEREAGERGVDVKNDTDDPGRFLVMRANLLRGDDMYAGLPESRENNQNNPASGNNDTKKKKKKRESYGPRVRENVSLALYNPQFLKLLLAYSLAQATLVSLASLMGQLPAGESTATMGLCWLLLTLAGSLSAVAVGVLVGKNKKYSGVLKLCYFGTVLSWVWLMTNIRANNQTLLLVSSALVGVFLVPIIPSTFSNAIEITYPVPEVVTVGLLCSAGNALAVPLIFAGQALLYTDAQVQAQTLTPASTNNNDNNNNNNNASEEVRFSPYAIFSTACLCVGLGSVLLYHSKREFPRLYLDVPRGERGAYDRDEEEAAAGGGG